MLLFKTQTPHNTFENLTPYKSIMFSFETLKPHKPTMYFLKTLHLINSQLYEFNINFSSLLNIFQIFKLHKYMSKIILTQYNKEKQNYINEFNKKIFMILKLEPYFSPIPFYNSTLFYKIGWLQNMPRCLSFISFDPYILIFLMAHIAWPSILMLV